MRVLLTESDPELAAEVEATLAHAGHEALSCVDRPGSPFPCRGAAGTGPCPLDLGAEVAVAVPGTLPAVPRPGDVGVVCALRHPLPLVVTGPGEDVVAEVERAAAAPLPQHTAAVVAELRTQRVGGTAAVVRSGTHLRVTLDLAAGTDRRTAERAAVRAEGVGRAIDPWAAKVDVAVDVLAD
jgi:hypothetical protein